MTRAARKLFEEAMRLDAEDRVALAGLLIESLEPESEEGVEEAWVAEVERRMAELDSGAVQTLPWDELRARLYGSSSGPGRR